MRFITADYILKGNGEVYEDTCLVMDKNGIIEELIPLDQVSNEHIEHFQGALIPGFINTHCHLELSHMKGLVPTGTSLLPFLKNVVQYRDFPQEVIDQAIVDADLEMQQNGIVAIGDICNKLDTLHVKNESPIAYYSFVEAFDFLQESMTDKAIAQYQPVFNGQSSKDLNKKSFVPHAPYTVSAKLFHYLNQQNTPKCTVSIHNQETAEENLLFEKGEGEFLDFFENFGFDMREFNPLGKRSIHYAIAHMDAKPRTIMVHNTTCRLSDIEAAIDWNEKTYWATCPNANLYIENSLPNYQLFLDAGAKMTIGTDSLTSNWQLSVAEEMFAIQKYCSYVKLQELSGWACLNGALALGYDSFFGSFEKGKSPGVNLINVIEKGEELYMTDGSVEVIVSPNKQSLKE